MDTSSQQLMANISHAPTDTSKHTAVHDMQDKAVVFMEIKHEAKVVDNIPYRC